jgi:hypothetical protein
MGGQIEKDGATIGLSRGVENYYAIKDGRHSAEVLVICKTQSLSDVAKRRVQHKL